MTALRLYLRSVLLEWLGYGSNIVLGEGGPVGSLNHLGSKLEREADRWAPVGVLLEVRGRTVPEVPRGVVRIVVEVCE